MFRSAYADVDIPNASLTDFVLGAAHEHSAKPALVDNATGLVITYGQLLERVRRAAAGLAALGVRKGDVVALSAPNSPEFAVAFHAIVRLGAVVTPANPANTSHEIAHQLDDSGAKVLVAAAALADKARAAIRETARPIELFTIDGAAEGVRSLESIALDAEPPAVEIDPATDVVVLPYSSGTTGLAEGRDAHAPQHRREPHAARGHRASAPERRSSRCCRSSTSTAWS